MVIGSGLTPWLRRRKGGKRGCGQVSRGDRGVTFAAARVVVSEFAAAVHPRRLPVSTCGLRNNGQSSAVNTTTAGSPNPPESRARGATGASRAPGLPFYWGARTYVMGIVNCTPDSFSGDGLTDAAAAVERGHRMIEEGADVLDIGGESTRPGAAPVDTDEELRRVLPVVEQLAARAAAAGVPL